MASSTFVLRAIICYGYTLYSPTHHPRRVENKVGHFMNYILALGTVSKCSEQIRVTLMEQQCTTCIVWNSAPNLDARAEAREEPRLLASREQPTGGLRQGQATNPLWPPLEVTLRHYLLRKKLYGMPRQCVSGLQKAARGENRFEKIPGLEGSLKHSDGGKGLHFTSQLTSHRRFNAAVTLKKVSIKKEPLHGTSDLRAGKKGQKNTL